MSPAILRDARDSGPLRFSSTICEVQGSGPASPVALDTVTVEGTVTGNFMDTLSGFFLQHPDCDGDASTSDGIWVYDRTSDAEVATDQFVRVTGEVREYYGLTEIFLEEAEVLSSDGDPVSPVVLDLPDEPVAATEVLESLEGMLVTLPESRVVGATNRFGETYLTPESSGLERIFRTAPDGRRVGMLTPGWWLTLNHGDRLAPITGPLHYTFENYKIAVSDLTPPPEVTPSEVKPDVLQAAAPRDLRVATYNLENLFDTVDDPDKNDTDWTLSPDEYDDALAVRAESIARFLGSPHIVVVQEVEKAAILADLAARPELSDANYQELLIEGPDERGIDVGILYDAERLEVMSAAQAQACVPDKPLEPEEPCELQGGDMGWSLFSRPPLVATFRDQVSGTTFAVIGNHFKSKRGGDAVTTPIRTAMAGHLLTLRDDVNDLGIPAIIAGDLNDFPDSEPILALTEAGLVNLHTQVPPASSYTFIYNGVSQILDYILVDPGAPFDVVSTQVAHVNVDFGHPDPEADTPAEARPRASDHDPVVATLRFTQTQRAVYLPRVLNRALARAPEENPTATQSPDVTEQPTAPATDVPTVTEGPGPTATNTPTRPPSTPTSEPEPTDTPIPPTDTRIPPTPTRPASGPPAFPLKIERLFFDGTEPRTEGDEYVQIRNMSSERVPMAGWRLISVQGEQVYRFPSDFSFEPEQTCRVYTDETHEEWCGLNWNHSNQAVWANGGDKAELRNAAGDLIDWYCYGDREGECE